MAANQKFHQQRQLVDALYSPLRESFSHLVGTHALHLVQMVRADCADTRPSRRALLDTWKQLDGVNNRWVSLLCDNGNDKFRTTCNSLVHGYTESVGDYILEGACHAQRVSALTRAEGNFYSALQSSTGHHITRRQWVQYTNALIDYVDAARAHGPNAPRSWECAAQAVAAGHGLGAWLDQTLLLESLRDKIRA